MMVCVWVGEGQWGKATLMENLYSFIFSPFIWKDKLYIVLQKWSFWLRSGFFWEVNSITLPLCPHQHHLAVTWHIWKTEAVVNISDLGSRRNEFLIFQWRLNLFWIALSIALQNAFCVWLLYEVLWLQEWFWIREVRGTLASYQSCDWGLHPSTSGRAIFSYWGLMILPWVYVPAERVQMMKKLKLFALIANCTWIKPVLWEKLIRAASVFLCVTEKSCRSRDPDT